MCPARNNLAVWMIYGLVVSNVVSFAGIGCAAGLTSDERYFSLAP
jgi:hypothetical protein